MHCLQACLQMLLYSMQKPVLSLEELDKITHHDPSKFTWQGQALLWLQKKGFQVENYENLDYREFAREGKAYLKRIWDAETFSIQEKYSNLRKEQKTARKIIGKDLKTVNSRLTIRQIKRKYEAGYFTMLSINPYAMVGKLGYGSHMIVIAGFDEKFIKIYDPDKPKPYDVTYQRLSYAISKKRKGDFNVIFVRLK